MARPAAALITGVFGSGKSTVLAEAADLLEVGGLPFAAIDVDWLGWAMTAADAAEVGPDGAAAPDGGASGPGPAGPHAAFGTLTLENLSLVVGNDRRHGIERFLLAHAVWRPAELDELRAALEMPVRVIRLDVPLPVVQARLGSDPTSSRRDDLARTVAFLASGVEPVAVDLVVDGTRPVADIAHEVIDWLGWRP